MLNNYTTITPKMRTRMTPELYSKVLKMAWDTFERSGIKGYCPNEQLSILILVGTDQEILSARNKIIPEEECYLCGTSITGRHWDTVDYGQGVEETDSHHVFCSEVHMDKWSQENPV